ncbi:MAG: VIT1/CCC1 transporter family protein [Bacteroidetes bacterium]|nr:VIT1/CCC1 transporter family protein [Bacteroidota bacterium]
MPHQEKHFTGSQKVRDIVIGMSDGLTVPFALTAGLTGAVASNVIIITAGLAEIIAGSIAMGLGGYLAGITEYQHYQSEKKREFWEVENLPEREKEEIREILGQYGVKETSREAFIEDLSQDPGKWVDFMMRFELNLEEPEVNQARNSALLIALSYVIGGMVPLSAYFFTSNPLSGLSISVVVTLLALFTFGYLKSKITGQAPLAGAIKTTIIGALASAAAFLIARLIS